MPRPDGIIWKYFTPQRKGKYRTGVCKFCGDMYVTNAVRMKNHLVNKCQRVPADVKAIFAQKSTLATVSGSKAVRNECIITTALNSAMDSTSSKMQCFAIKQNTERKHNEAEEVSQASTSNISFNCDKEDGKRSRSSSNMSGFVDFCSPQEKAKLNILLARAIFATATPFNIVENPYWIELFKHLRPAYSLPSRYCISKPLLDKEYKLIQEEISIKMKEADALTLVSDGWTDNTGNSIINVLFCTPKPLFFKSVTSNCESHTGEFISKILSDAIDSVGHKKVCAVITDNAANMKNAWNMLQDKYPHLIIFGCLAHGINLLIKDIIISIPIFDKTIKDVKEIIKIFKNRQLPREMLKKYQMEKTGKLIALILAVDTRWGSNAKMLESFLKCQEHMEAITVNRDITKIMPKTLRRTILDNVNFWPLVENIHQLLKVPSDVITKLEGDSANLSYVHNTLNEMERDLKQQIYFVDKNNQDQILNYFKSRKEFISHPSQLAAHFLNAKLRNNTLDELEENEAIDYIIDLGQKLNLCVEKLYADIGEFNAKVSIWSNASLWKAADIMEPSVWWKGLCAKRELSKIAVILLSIPATAAASERNWSCFGNIKTVKRNRLNTDTVMKLVSVKFNLNICNDLVNINERHKKETISSLNKEIVTNNEIDEIQSISSEIEEEIILQMDTGISESSESEDEVPKY